MRARQAGSQRRPLNRWLCLVGLLLPSALPAQSPHDAAVHIPPDANQQVPHVGIVGQVARPGVYQIRHATVELQKLVQRAGGLTLAASRNLRIIRGGRAGQQVFFSPGAAVTLLSGDLVIVDFAQQPLGSPYKSHGQSRLSGSSESESKPAAVQIGLVNLIHRPVVLKIPAEQATPAGIVASLGQPPEIVHSLKIIRSRSRWAVPHSKIGGNRTSRGVSERLASTTVLVFDPTVIDHRVLPELDRPYPVESPMDLLSTKVDALEESTRTNTSDRSGGEFAGSKSTGRGNQWPSSQFSQLAPSTSLVNRPKSKNPNPATFQAEVRLPGAGKGKENSSLLRTPRLSLTQGPPPGIAALAQNESLQSRSIRRTVPMEKLRVRPSASSVKAFSSATTSTKSRQSKSPWMLVAVGVMGVVFVAVACRFWLSRIRRGTSPSKVSTVEKRISVLDSLIRNRLRVVEEPVKIPTRSEFFGRPAAPIPVRVDAQHATPAPHLPLWKQSDRVPISEPSSKQKKLVRIDPARHDATPSNLPASDSSETQGAGLLDRVLLTVQRRPRT